MGKTYKDSPDWKRKKMRGRDKKKKDYQDTNYFFNQEQSDDNYRVESRER